MISYWNSFFHISLMACAVAMRSTRVQTKRTSVEFMQKILGTDQQVSKKKEERKKY